MEIQIPPKATNHEKKEDNFGELSTKDIKETTHTQVESILTTSSSQEIEIEERNQEDIQGLSETDQINIIFDIIDNEKINENEKKSILSKNMYKFSPEHHQKILQLLGEEGLCIKNLKIFGGLWSPREQIWKNLQNLIQINPQYEDAIKEQIEDIVSLSPPLQKLSPENQHACILILRKLGLLSRERMEHLQNENKVVKTREALENTQAVEETFENILLKNSKKINEGEKGTIHLITPKKIQEDIKNILKERGIWNEYAQNQVDEHLQEYFGEEYKEHDKVLKTLKIFDKKAGEKEFNAHQEVYNIMKDKGDEYAKIPKVYLAKEKPVTETLQDHPLYGKSDSIYFLTMDYINGKDFLTHIYDQVVRSTGRETEGLSFYELEEEVKKIIPDWEEHTKQGIVIHNDEEREKAIRKAGTKNIQKIKKYCQKENITIPKTVPQKIENTLEELHNKNWYHRDLHARNIMVDYDENNTINDVFLIDFGTTVHEEDKKNAYKEDDLKFRNDTDVLNVINPFVKNESHAH